MILLIGGEKGGTGKSTISTNIAVTLAHKGHEIVIVDCDPQGTSTKWLTRLNKFYSDFKVIILLPKNNNCLFDSLMLTFHSLATRHQRIH